LIAECLVMGRTFATLLWDLGIWDRFRARREEEPQFTSSDAMTIFERYVFRQAGGALLIILFSLSAIVWVALALRQLNVVTSQGQSAWMLFKMTTLALPGLIAIIAPFALLIATIHTLNRLNGDSELIVLTASGATIWTPAKPILLLATLVALGVTFVNHAAMPWSFRLLREYVVQVRTDLLTQVIQPGRFSSPERNLTFHIRERTLNGELRGLIMHDTRDKKQSQSYLAERGVIVKQEPSSYLVMSEGHIVRRQAGDEPAQVIAFDKYAIDLAQFERKVAGQNSDLKTRERYLSELLNPEPTSKRYRQAPGRFWAEVHERFSNPLYPIAFALIALAWVGQAQSTRQNRLHYVAAAFVIAVGARVAGLALNNIVSIETVLAPLLYVLPIAAAGSALWLLSHPTREPTAPAFIAELFEAITGVFRKFPNIFARRNKGQTALRQLPAPSRGANVR
jgi:lipopolysaccharide export system permease protein